jgi:hypothetical protein
VYPFQGKILFPSPPQGVYPHHYTQVHKYLILLART